MGDRQAQGGKHNMGVDAYQMKEWKSLHLGFK
jgi:hypothetical protein